ncbi:hypothetical protein [Streptomyces sp. KL116D]|uniref:hypothetical protein n=1 Tax=Streptomyces sp. KL116D TaxID=3045152 RepID=UPI003556D339
MSSVVGLLEERERVAAQRVEVLRGQADLVLAELREAELDWERFVVARETVAEVLAGPDVVKMEEAAPEEAAGVVPSLREAVPRSVVPSWRRGLSVSVLSPEYQRLTAVLGGASGPLTCKELGVEVTARTRVEGIRCRARRLVNRGWLVREPSGRFTLAPGLRDGGS